MANPTIATTFTTVGADGVQLTMQRIGRTASETAAATIRSGTVTGQRYGEAARQIAFATENMARMGTVTGEATKQIISQGSMMAFSFGPQGAIVGAVAIAAMAIGELFSGISKQAKQAADDAIEEFNRIARGTSQGTRAAVAALINGDAEIGENTTPEKAGLARAYTQRDELRALLAGKQTEGGFLAQDMGVRENAIKSLEAVEKTITSLTAKIQKYTKEGNKQAVLERTLADSADAIAKAKEAQATAAKKWGSDDPMFSERDLKGVGLLLARKPIGAEGNAQLDRIAGNLGLNAPTTVSSGMPTQAQMDKELAATFKSLDSWALDHGPAIAKQFQPIGAMIAAEISNSLTIGLTDMFSTLFSGGGIKGAIVALARSVLAGLGQLFAKIAVAAIMLSSMMKKFLESIAEMNPWKAGAVAVAMYAAAVVLGGAAGGAVSGGGNYGSYGAAASSDTTSRIILGANSAATASGMTPRPVTAITVIGPRDPVAMRGIQELMDNANRRGG